MAWNGLDVWKQVLVQHPTSPTLKHDEFETNMGALVNDVQPNPASRGLQFLELAFPCCRYGDGPDLASPVKGNLSPIAMNNTTKWCTQPALILESGIWILMNDRPSKRIMNMTVLECALAPPCWSIYGILTRL